MSRQQKTLILSVASLVALCATTVILNAGASPKSPLRPNSMSQESRAEPGTRNLSLQPEAFRMSRRLGERFITKARGTTTTTGTLIVGTSRQAATIIRRQTDNGESVEVILGDRTLTWRDSEGVRGGPSSPSATERTLVERLIFDSPDQFVLGQLRGASYFTVARNVRPAGVADNYAGPFWTVVRIDDPQRNEEIRPQSSWRLYYINTGTGLIDRVVSQLNGQTIEVDVRAWSEQGGEKTPSHITWSINSRITMSYQVSTFSHTD